MDRIISVTQAGQAPVLDHRETIAPLAGEVRVRLCAAALNFADLLMIDGRYQETPPFPFVAGLEGAGVIEACGPGTTLLPGTRVAVNASGTLADRGVFSQEACLPIPDSMSMEDAAGFQIAYGTSHLALTGPASLQSGQTMVVLGAGGGVGLTAVEIGAALGAKVIGVARGADKLAAVRKAGAAEVIDSAEMPDLTAALREMGRVDIVYDAVGDAPGLAAFRALTRGGKHLVIGFAGGKPPTLPLNHALVKNISIIGFYWGGYRTLAPDLMRASLTDLFAMYDAGKLHPTASAILPLENFAEGYEALRARTAIGKVILSISNEVTG